MQLKKLLTNKYMKLRNASEIKNAEDARQYAIDWQSSFQDYNYSYGELIAYANLFEELGKSYNLTEEFKENGII